MSQTEQATVDALARALRTSEDRYRRLAHAMPQLVWTLDRDNALEFVNERWVAYTGLSLAETVASPEKAMHADDRPGLVARWADAVHSSEPLEAQCRIRRAAGRRVPLVRGASGACVRRRRRTGRLGSDRRRHRGSRAGGRSARVSCRRERGSGRRGDRAVDLRPGRRARGADDRRLVRRLRARAGRQRPRRRARPRGPRAACARLGRRTPLSRRTERPDRAHHRSRPHGVGAAYHARAAARVGARRAAFRDDGPVRSRERDRRADGRARRAIRCAGAACAAPRRRHTTRRT